MISSASISARYLRNQESRADSTLNETKEKLGNQRHKSQTRAQKRQANFLFEEKNLRVLQKKVDKKRNLKKCKFVNINCGRESATRL